MCCCLTDVPCGLGLGRGRNVKNGIWREEFLVGKRRFGKMSNVYSLGNFGWWIELRV